MKKTLAAVAVLGSLSGAALAPSNVQIYGIVDAGLRLTDPTVGGVSSTFGVASGQQSGSRFGLKGAKPFAPSLKRCSSSKAALTSTSGNRARAAAC